MAVFDRGDIVSLRFDPAEGHELRGANHPALAGRKHCPAGRPDPAPLPTLQSATAP